MPIDPKYFRPTEVRPSPFPLRGSHCARSPPTCIVVAGGAAHWGSDQGQAKLGWARTPFSALNAEPASTPAPPALAIVMRSPLSSQVPKVKMEELCREMVLADIKLVEKGDAACELVCAGPCRSAARGHRKTRGPRHRIARATAHADLFCALACRSLAEDRLCARIMYCRAY